MAPKRPSLPKRPSPLEDPSAASSSEEEAESENVSDKEDEEDQEQDRGNKVQAESEEEDDEEDAEEEEDDDEEEEEEEETPPIPPPVDKKPSARKPTLTTTQPSLESDPDEGSDSESDSDKTQHSPTASDYTIKPIVSKPMDDLTKSKKSATKPAVLTSATVVKTASKRPAETEQNGKESRTKKGKISHGDEEDGAVEEKKSAFSRLWSEDDEIAILQGMIDYKSKKGADPYADMGAFHEFLKKSLHVDVSKNQLTDKIRRLKKKYQNNAKKGEDPVFFKPHEYKSFELSKKIWGGGASKGVDDNVKNNDKQARKSGKVDNSVASLKDEVQELALQEASKGEIKASQEDFWSIYPRLGESLQSEKGSYLSLSKSGEGLVKEKMSLIGSAKAKELEEKWKNLRVDEIELYLKRVELIQEQTKLVLAAMKSSKS